MRIAVAQFPGSNCDQDALHALRDDLGLEAEYVWHEERDLSNFDGAIVPGGFTYGDYLRAGAIAARAPIMDGLRAMAESGRPVLGICNGFQILCEAGLLPGALLANTDGNFRCHDVELRAISRSSFWTMDVHGSLRIPIAHYEGRYTCDGETLDSLRRQDRVAFEYIGENPNGSLDGIAGVLNEGKNVLGMMPHPERATRELLGGTDGLCILSGFLRAPVMA